MANKSTSKNCEGVDLSTHKIVTIYALAVATVAVAVAAIALRYAVTATREVDYLLKNSRSEVFSEATTPEEKPTVDKPVEQTLDSEAAEIVAE